MGIAEHIRRVAQAGGDSTAIICGDRVLSWSSLGAGAEALDRLLGEQGVGTEAVVGLLGRNGLEQVAAYVGVLAAGRALLLINATRPPALVAQEVEALRLACILGDTRDLAEPVLEAARRAGSMAVEVCAAGAALALAMRSAPAAGPFRQRQPGGLIEIQTSGTTGAPKRIAIAERTIAASLRDGVRNAAGTVDQQQLRPKSSPTLMFTPLVHTSGTFNTLLSVFDLRPIVLFEKFEPEQYRQALRRYRPKFAPLPPTAIKMMVDSEATREDFESVIAVRAGTAPLPVDLQQAFENKFGVPVLTTYGATEFMGVATSWTLEDYRRFGASKRGSVGRPSKGVEIRVVDPATGQPVGTDEQGLLQARLDRIDGGREWIATTDLARIDEDGFLYILGRADDAIIRGGFKVMGGMVADVVRQFPGIYDALVLGRPDERLGEVPVAVIETYPGFRIDQAELRAFLKERLTAYEVPARFHVVERLPRTVSDKVSRPETLRIIEALED